LTDQVDGAILEDRKFFTGNDLESGQRVSRVWPAGCRLSEWWGWKPKS